MPGKIPAQMTANMVMASANRLMDVRHFCLNKNNMAEINVPAWPIPTQKTKLTIAKPQPTGLFNPHTPTPSQIKYPMSENSNAAKDIDPTNPINHHLGALVSAGLDIISVTSLNDLFPKTWGTLFISSLVMSITAYFLLARLPNILFDFC